MLLFFNGWLNENEHSSAVLVSRRRVESGRKWWRKRTRARLDKSPSHSPTVRLVSVFTVKLIFVWGVAWVLVWMCMEWLLRYVLSALSDDAAWMANWQYPMIWVIIEGFWIKIDFMPQSTTSGRKVHLVPWKKTHFTPQSRTSGRKVNPYPFCM